MNSIGSYVVTVFVLWSGVSIAAMASDVFVAPFGGYSLAATSFDIQASAAENSNDKGTIKIAESEHVGFMVGVNTNDPGNVYFLYSHQSTELQSAGMFVASVVSVVNSPNIGLGVDYFHLGGSLFFPNGNLKPYVTASLGLTQMRPNGDYTTESRFSMGFGGGVEYALTQRFAMFADVRGFATFINSDQTLFCDGNLCFWFIRSDLMWQAQANFGLKLAF